MATNNTKHKTRYVKQVLYKLKLRLFGITIFMLLGLSNVLIKIMSFKRLTKWLSNVPKESDCTDAHLEPNQIVDQKTKSRLRVLVKTIESMSLKTPWRSMCFEKAITCAIILRWFKVDYTIFFGLKKDEDNQLKAHAWTKAGAYYLTGYENMHEFKSVFSAAYKM